MIKDIKIKDTLLVSELKALDKLPISDGSGNPKGVSIDLIKQYIENNLSEPFISGKGLDSAVTSANTGCEASGDRSFATGIYAKATGVASTALGRYCQATGRAAIAAGGFLTSIKLTGDANTVTYICKPNFVQKNYPSYLIESKILSYGETDGTNSVLATITGVTLLDDSTLLLTLDKTLSSEAISNKSFCMSFCHAKGTSSVSLAESVGAFGNGSVAMGQSLAIGKHSVAGGVSIASGAMSSTMGNGTIASGEYSHAEGSYTIASGIISHAEGQHTIASGIISHAEGNFTTASGGASHAEGVGLFNIYFSGDGTDNKYLIKNGSNWQFIEDLERLVGANVHEDATIIATILSYELAEDGYTITVVLDKSLGTLDPYGKYTVNLAEAEGEYSHSQNAGTKASGQASTSTGYMTVAEGDTTATFGNRTIARGDSSVTFGEHTFTTNTAEFALGVSNISHTGETADALTLLSVGYGEGNPGLDMSTRIEQLIPFKSMADGKNALEVMRNGDIWFGGYETGLKVWDGKNLNTLIDIPVATKDSYGGVKQITILPLQETATLEEVVTAYNALIEALKNAGINNI